MPKPTSSGLSKLWALSACKTLLIWAPFPGSGIQTNVSGCLRPSSIYSKIGCTIKHTEESFVTLLQLKTFGDMLA